MRQENPELHPPSTHLPCVIRTEEHDGQAHLYLTGELDLAGKSNVEDTLASAQLDHSAVVADIRGLTFMDSSGIDAFVNASNRARGSRNEFFVVNSPERLRRVFDLTDTLYLLSDPLKRAG